MSNITWLITEAAESLAGAAMHKGMQNAVRFSVCLFASSSSRMRVINHNWSATKQRLRPQSVAEISRHSVLLIKCNTNENSLLKNPRHNMTVAATALLQYCDIRSSLL